MPELRQDPVTGNWVIIATERAKRPSDFVHDARDHKTKGQETCPFCPGNEDQTPPEVFAFRPSGTKADAPGWYVRVVPNKFAALRPEEEGEEEGEGLLYRKLPGKGAHEVIIETPVHNLSFPEYSVDQALKVLKAWRQRYLQHYRQGEAKYVQIFKNHGRVAGASLEHPHSQLIATSLVPPTVAKEVERFSTYLVHQGRCLLCDLLDRETRQGARVVAFNNRFLAFCPYASRFPFETWILPQKHQPHFGEAEEEDFEDLASIMRDVLGRIQTVLGDPPFNLILRSAPNSGEVSAYHWRLEVLPRLTVVAGFEYGTGVHINPTTPELAAEALTRAHEEEQNEGKA